MITQWLGRNSGEFFYCLCLSSRTWCVKNVFTIITSMGSKNLLNFVCQRKKIWTKFVYLFRTSVAHIIVVKVTCFSFVIFIVVVVAAAFMNMNFCSKKKKKHLRYKQFVSFGNIDATVNDLFVFSALFYCILFCRWVYYVFMGNCDSCWWHIFQFFLLSLFTKCFD